MKFRLLILFGLASVLLITLTSTIANANSTSLPAPAMPDSLYRCENNYSDDEIAAIQDNGDDGYEPDDCPLLAHVLTGPMRFNFCKPGDEDWTKFKAMPNTLYQIRAEPPWNYPTEPHLDLYINDLIVAQNDHYFNNNAEVWWANTTNDVIWVYARATELRGRHDCGNNEYTLSLHLFPGESLAPSPVTPTITFTSTLTITPTLPYSPTPTLTPTPSN